MSWADTLFQTSPRTTEARVSNKAQPERVAVIGAIEAGNRGAGAPSS